MRYRIAGTCKREGCENPITIVNKSGYCGRHKWMTRPKRPWNRARFQAWLDASPENRKRYRASIKAWAEKNPEKAREQDRQYQKRKRDKDILKAAAKARANLPPPSPKISALLKLAEVKATQAQYGIQRVAYS